MARRNYKVYANLGSGRRATKQFSVVLHTGGSSSFIRKYAIPRDSYTRIRPSRKKNVRDAINRRIRQ